MLFLLFIALAFSLSAGLMAMSYKNAQVSLTFYKHPPLTCVFLLFFPQTSFSLPFPSQIRSFKGGSVFDTSTSIHTLHATFS